MVPEGIEACAYRASSFSLGSQLTDDAVLSHHSALQYHGKAHTVHYEFPYLTQHVRQSFEYWDVKFIPVSYPKALQERQAEFFGVETHRTDSGLVRFTDVDRTMVDVLSRPDLSGGWEEIWRSLQACGYFNLDKILKYLLLLDSAITAAKVGYFLEQHRVEMQVPESYLALLRQHAPNQPCYLDRSRRSPGKLQSAWNLIVPENVAERRWEEFV